MINIIFKNKISSQEWQVLALLPFPRAHAYNHYHHHTCAGCESCIRTLCGHDDRTVANRFGTHISSVYIIYYHHSNGIVTWCYRMLGNGRKYKVGLQHCTTDRAANPTRGRHVVMNKMVFFMFVFVSIALFFIFISISPTFLVHEKS